MGTLFRYSEIRIPNDPAFGGPVAKYVGEIGRVIGFAEMELRSVEHGVLETVSALLEYSFDPNEDASLVVSCEHVPEGLKVTFKDKGLPFGSAEVPPGRGVCPIEDASRLCSRIFGLKGDFDEIRFRNLGQGGKETVLIKHLKSGSIADVREPGDLESHESRVVRPPSPSERPKWIVRPMMPSEAPEISKLVYKAYGYTYAHDDVYYPERIIALNETGRLHSAVALADNKEIAGHCAMQFLEDNPRIAELSQAVVKPEYRSGGCLWAMTGYLIRFAEEKGLRGLFTKSVTEHVFSQKTAWRFGFNDSALFLGIIPCDTVFKGVSEPLTHRGSLLIEFRYLEKPSSLICHAPTRYREMIARIYENLGASPVMRTDPPEAAGDAVPSILRLEATGGLQLVRIVVERPGSDVAARVKTKLQELESQGFKIFHIYLDLGDPWTPALSRDLDGLGFFFAGILPEGSAKGDALILQFLSDVNIDYDSIHVRSDLAREMLAYIKDQEKSVSRPLRHTLTA